MTGHTMTTQITGIAAGFGQRPVISTFVVMAAIVIDVGSPCSSISAYRARASPRDLLATSENASDIVPNLMAAGRRATRVGFRRRSTQQLTSLASFRRGTSFAPRLVIQKMLYWPTNAATNEPGELLAMGADRSTRPIVHLVGSIPLSDAETVFRTVAGAIGQHLIRIPDGETGIRKTWIRFLQDVLAANPAVELASDLPPFRFVQWDGKLVREIPRLRLKTGAKPDPDQFITGYADMAIDSWRTFDRLQMAGVIPVNVKFQISLPTPIAPTYNNMVPQDRPGILPALTRHFIGEVAKIAAALPNDRIAVQWDVCQEVLAWEGYYDQGPIDFRYETIGVLATIGDAVPAAIDLGYHLCYGSPADEHLVQPRDAGIMVEIANAIVEAVKRPIQFFHMPVPKGRTDDDYYRPLAGLRLGTGTELYLGLVHYNDAGGDAARLATARRHVQVDGVATECGMARGAPARLAALLAAHARAVET